MSTLPPLTVSGRLDTAAISSDVLAITGCNPASSATIKTSKTFVRMIPSDEYRLRHGGHASDALLAEPDNVRACLATRSVLNSMPRLDRIYNAIGLEDSPTQLCS